MKRNTVVKLVELEPWNKKEKTIAERSLAILSIVPRDYTVLFLNFLRSGRVREKREDLRGPFISGSRAGGSRILSTAGRKIRYRFPSSKLSTRHVWEATQNAIRHTRTAPASYVRNFGRSLVCTARVILTTRTHTRLYPHTGTHLEHRGNRLKDLRPLIRSSHK